jgi:hypothetical protein
MPRKGRVVSESERGGGRGVKLNDKKQTESSHGKQEVQREEKFRKKGLSI